MNNYVIRYIPVCVCACCGQVVENSNITNKNINFGRKYQKNSYEKNNYKQNNYVKYGQTHSFNGDTMRNINKNNKNK